MLTAGIILSIIGFIITLFIILSDDDANTIGFLGLVMYTAGLLLLFSFLSTRKTAIECYEGNNPYKQQIVYELKDSIQVPVDTIYTLKK
jgi:hypothetical protein